VRLVRALVLLTALVATAVADVAPAGADAIPGLTFSIACDPQRLVIVNNGSAAVTVTIYGLPEHVSVGNPTVANDGNPVSVPLDNQFDGVEVSAASGARVVDSPCNFPVALWGALHSGKAMDDPAGSTAPGTQMVQWEPHGDVNQQWLLVPVAHTPYDIYAIYSLQSGMWLDVANASKDDGAAVIQWPWNGGLNQFWVLIPLADLVPGGNPYVYLIISANSAKVLAVAGASLADGAPIVQSTWVGGLNQLWVREPL
jgi:hypothetical protein